MKKTCPICRHNKKKLVWNNPIRSAKNKWTKKSEKIFWCLNCDLRYSGKFRYNLQDNKIFRKLYDGSNSIKKYKSFNKKREQFKLNKILKLVTFKNKVILESNCGAATNLDYLKSISKKTVGLDSEIYRNHVEKKHFFFKSMIDIQKSGIKFDIILSLAEIEHQYDVINFIKKLKKLLKKNGYLIFRIPNYNNVYLHLLGKKYLKFDFRTSHNYYFSEKSCDYLFKKLKLKTIFKKGLQEYSINHLIEYIKKGKRVKNFPNLINYKISNEVSKNLETQMVSTSLLYILKK